MLEYRVMSGTNSLINALISPVPQGAMTPPTGQMRFLGIGKGFARQRPVASGGGGGGGGITTSGLIVDLNGTSYSAGGGTWTNSIDNTTWTMINTVYDATYSGPRFNGSSSRAYISSLTNFSGTQYTIVCYYYKYAVGNYQIMTASRTASNTANQFLLFEGRYFEYGNSVSADYSWSPPPASQTAVTMLVRNGTTSTAYVNNVIVGTQTSGTLVTINNSDFSIGVDYRDFVNYLNGTIKRFLIYNRAVSPAEVSSVYTTLVGG